MKKSIDGGYGLTDDDLMDMGIKKQSRKKSRNKRYISEDERVGRNELCPCGSGRRFKKCCM